ncbi:MAG: NAD+ synthase [Deltaproteobacteria bacterium]|nr:NAD+ synthase [Deltaproteobacteria bacterium]
MALLRIGLAQINSTVGAIDENAEKILRYSRLAMKAGVDLVVFPELAVTGYPPEDLLLKPGFIEKNVKVMERVARSIKGISAIIGFADSFKGGIYNAASLVSGGRVRGVYRKMHLPNYGVFDEKRYFMPGSAPLNARIGGVTLGLGICEDIWSADGPAIAEATSGARVIVNINASPYHFGKHDEREELLAVRARETGAVIVYVNSVGGQDELVFDGRSMVVNARGIVDVRARAFEEDFLIYDIEKWMVKGSAFLKGGTSKKKRVSTVSLGALSKAVKKPPVRQESEENISEMEEVRRALTLGIRDYVRKNGFKKCVIGLSGGIDSALVACLASDAVGKKNVLGVFMPSRYSSKESLKDARELARNLEIEFKVIPIDKVYSSYLKTLKPSFKGRKADVTEENLQARVRGNVLMALSNKFGFLVLTTGNKSETGVGYCTLYGDMAGGFAAIKDVPKTMVYGLSEHINQVSGEELIPLNVLTKAPTAELRPNQTDQDTLPPYDVLDEILREYVENDRCIADIVKDGYGEGLVRKVVKMVDLSEYKRRQAPPGIKITPKAFGRDRRMPITNGYKG